jgi:hypothetical protein
MDESLRAQIDTHQRHLDSLIRRGRQLRDAIAAEPSNALALAEARAWQQHCALAVSQLSGGAKAHWLARSYSDAFLISGAAGAEADLTAIVGRVVGVLERAVGSLARLDDADPAVSSSDSARPIRRFDFVHDEALRPVLDQAYRESRRVLENGEFGRAMVLACCVLEALLADALAHLGRCGALPEGGVAEWSLDTRIAAARRAGLIRNGCARLPPIARRYRELTDSDGELRAGVMVREREARVAAQVLHIVMRDLDPGR